MSRLVNLDTVDRLPLPPEDPPDTVGYWNTRDRWAALGREIGALRAAARPTGRTLEEMPGAPALIASFKALGKELDRHAR